MAEGYTRIPNKLMEALATGRLTRTQVAVVVFVLRQTYGYNRRSKAMSASYISNGTGMSLDRIRHCLSELIKMGVLKKDGSSNRIRQLMVADPDHWNISKVRKSANSESAQKCAVKVRKSANLRGTEVRTIKDTHKDTFKENIDSREEGESEEDERWWDD